MDSQQLYCQTHVTSQPTDPDTGQHKEKCDSLGMAEWNEPALSTESSTSSMLPHAILCLQKRSYLTALNITESANILDKYGTVDTRKVRQVLREKAFENWSQKKHKGKGVLLYQQYTPANKWIRNHKGLSCSEWREAIKMNANVSAVRSVPGRSSGSNLCRRCDREVETLAHVLGACPHGELLRNTRHHTVRSILATALRNKGYSVYEEVHGISSEGSNRRIDINSFKPPSLEGYIIDPTVRFESHEHQPEEVHEEKRNIYEPFISFYKDKYHLESIGITGLMIGARGTIPRTASHVARLRDGRWTQTVTLWDPRIGKRSRGRPRRRRADLFSERVGSHWSSRARSREDWKKPKKTSEQRLKPVRQKQANNIQQCRM
ncbi:hypothetical protein ANN_09620 [Periplaneta americana]|uniref:Uncharacterized protein n=1 Tax=Periplaneta americana TaxID=6978 RepID=A0ABQ8TLT7_PERAM|nr:hypothetical protein ANN_09620 [Periplaneta americana]